jgi:hypothetical protein
MWWNATRPGHSPGAIWRPPAFWLHRKAPEHRFQPSQPIDGLDLITAVKPGYIEGQSVTIEFRWADSKYDQLPALGQSI